MGLRSSLTSIEKPSSSNYMFKPYQKYKVISFEEGLLGVIFLQGSSINVKKFEDVLNEHSAQGWYIAAFLTEKKRRFLFWNVERALIILAADQQKTSAA